MASFLPNEILLRIFAFAETSSLYNICLASKSFSILARPMPFHWFWGRKLRQFLLVLARQPYLALAVRHANVDDWDVSEEDDMDGFNVPFVLKDDISLLENVVRKSSLPKRIKERSMAAISRGSEDKEVALLFMLCTNVESINFTPAPPNLEASLLMDVARFSVRSTSGSNQDRSMMQPKSAFCRLHILQVLHWET